MSDKRAQILEALNRVIPQLDGQEQDRLVYGEGASWNRLSPFMADKKDVQEYLSRAVSDEDGILPAVTKLLPQRETYLATRDFVNAAEELGYRAASCC